MLVRYSDHNLINRPIFRPPFEYRSAIQMPCSMVPGIWIANHFNNKQVKVPSLEVSAVYLLAIQIPLVLNFHQVKSNAWLILLPCDGHMSWDPGQDGKQVFIPWAFVQLMAQWLDEPRPRGTETKWQYRGRNSNGPKHQMVHFSSHVLNSELIGHYLNVKIRNG